MCALQTILARDGDDDHLGDAVVVGQEADFCRCVLEMGFCIQKVICLGAGE